MPLEIRPADTPRELRRFVDVPWQVYDPTRHPQWVPPLRLAVHDVLDDRRNPFYAQAARRCFVAWRDGRPVGRIAAIENRAHNAFHDDRTGFFGFLDVRDDAEAAGALLDAAGAWLRDRGLTTMRGPVSPSTNHECGLLVDGFGEHPMVQTPWNPPYVAGLLEGAGFVGVKDLLGWHIPVGDPGFALPPLYAEHAARARAETGLVFRDVDLRRFDREVELLWGVYNQAWERNWGFVPVTRAEFGHLARDLKQIIDPRFAFVAEVAGDAAGFALAVLDYNRIFRRIRTGRLLPTGLLRLLLERRALRSGRVMALGVRREHRTRSVFALFAHEFVRRARAFGATHAEASWVLEDNHLMNRPLRGMGATPYRRWRLYERPLVPAAAAGAGAGAGAAW